VLSVLSGCGRTSAAVRVHSARIDDGWRADRRARIRVGVRAIEPGATVAPPSTLADRLDTQLATRRVMADVVTIVAVASLALTAGRLLESVLIGVTSRDPLTLTLVPATMLATALLAGLLPALRTASVDPAIALWRD
jgi:hypothetical protein